MAKFFKPQKHAKPARQQPLQTAEVEALDHQGRGIVRGNNNRGTKQQTYFVAGVLPGEIIRFRPQLKHQAECHRIEQAAEQRQKPPCPYYQRCGGCDLQHLDIAGQRQHKQTTISQLLMKFAGCDETELNWQPPLLAEPYHYRRKTRLAAYWKANNGQANNGQLVLGFRQPKSKQITPVEQCLVLVEPLERLLVPLQQCLQTMTIGRSLGHVELIQTTAIHVVLRLLAAPTEPQRELLQRFAQQHSLSVWLQLDEGIEPLLTEQPDPDDSSIDGDALYFTVGDFLQINADLNPLMVEQAIDWLDAEPEHKVLDLFSGLGNFSLPLARRVANVHAVEGVSRMAERLQDNAERASLKNVSASSCDLSQITAQQLNDWQADMWLMDPARAGAERIAQALNELPEAERPERILYVSCAPDTLARDSRLILAAGYRIKQLSLVDMFPQTHHIETMVCFERAA